MESILLNNYNIIYIINNIQIFNKRIFINECLKYIIKVRSLSLLITNRDTRIIKSILNKKNNKVNLELINIIIIKGFYINIIFKIILYKKGI